MRQSLSLLVAFSEKFSCLDFEFDFGILQLKFLSRQMKSILLMR